MYAAKLSAFLSDVSMRCICADRKTHCVVPTVMAGEPTSLTCYFNNAFKENETNFVVQHVNQQQEMSDVLTCLWMRPERPDCDPAPGYIFDEKISRNLTLRIPSAAKHHVGSYMCLVTPSDLDDAVAYNSLSVTAIVIPVILILVLICAGVIVFMCRKRLAARFGKAARNRNNDHVESHPLVSVTPSHLINTAVTDNKEIPDKDICGTCCTYICNRTAKLVEETGAIVILGPERCGKSTLGHDLVAKFAEKGFCPLALDHPNQWLEKKQDDKKHIVLLDECPMDESSMEALSSMRRDQCYIISINKSDDVNSEQGKAGLPSFLKTAPVVNLSKQTIPETGGSEQLFQACQEENVEQMENLLSVGVEPNRVNDEGKTPLHIACEKGNPDIVVHLVLAGSDADVRDTKGLTPLHHSCISWSTATHSVQQGVAQRHGQYDNPRERVVKILLEYGASLEVGDWEKGRKPLHIACEHGNNDLVKILLDAGASVDAQDNNGRTPLHVACRYNHVDVMKSLLATESDVDAKDDSGFTPLHLACKHNFPDVTKCLIEAKSDVNAKGNNGNTPLHVACVNKAIDSAEALLGANADIEARNEADNTPLHMACVSGSKEIVQMLLKHGADTQARNNTDDIPASVAKANYHPDIASMLSPRKLSKV
ncbi:hypothetical protein BaRGS_00031937 [Batillaria attramentaria]|uniref:Ig-like domain-containing protein n=1 Tax=Batillaria attramentaria TaxID=370345 RepID=A0ABD0JP92_9CAEN